MLAYGFAPQLIGIYTTDVVAIVCICLLRIFLDICDFSIVSGLGDLNLSFPIAWILTSIVQGIYYVHVVGKLPKGDRLF